MADQHLRMSDAERDLAAADLGEHYAQGRLTTDEHSERLDRIWAARTRGELGPIFADLPGTAPAPPRPVHPAPAYAAPVSRPRRRGLPLPLVIGLVILLGVTLLAHLPLILVGLAVWFLLSRGACSTRRQGAHWSR